jgi:TetR/AcrR family transcriptional regulator, transcriptional repressor for nem operon
MDRAVRNCQAIIDRSFQYSLERCSLVSMNGPRAVDEAPRALVQSVPPGRRPGRPRTFDEEQVLDALTQLFVERGYEATSVSDIAEVAGLNKSSLYNTFGTKHELFDRILDRYVSARLAQLATASDVAGSGIDGLHAFVDLVRSERDTPMGTYGCLAISSGVELGSSSPEVAALAARFRSRVEAQLRAIVALAADAGEIDPAHVEHYSTMLMMLMLGVSVAFRSGADDDEVERIFAAAHTTIDTWRI